EIIREFFDGAAKLEAAKQKSSSPFDMSSFIPLLSSICVEMMKSKLTAIPGQNSCPFGATVTECSFPNMNKCEESDSSETSSEESESDPDPHKDCTPEDCPVKK